jgi:hypothetical protein
LAGPAPADVLLTAAAAPDPQLATELTDAAEHARLIGGSVLAEGR